MKNIEKKLLIIIGLGAIFLFTSFVWGSTIAFKKGEAVKEGIKDLIIKDNKVEKVSHIKTPDPVKGIYMTSWVASTRDWRSNMVKMIDTTEVNSIVIDVKDYTGKISFEIFDPEFIKIGSPEKRINDIKEFISVLHEKNIYVIARISVFQDAFWVKKRPDLAVKTKAGAVWKDRKGIAWLDPCSKEVWDYIVKIAKETEKVGFDELNFDYIRFPSDGNMKDIAYDFCPQGFNRADMLESFFKYLSEQLKDTGIPISADMFGFVSTNIDDLNIGQVLEKAAPHFDYICPMVYPSHYPPTYGGFKNPADHPYEVIKLAMDTAVKRLLNQEAGLAPLATSTPQFSAEETKRIGSKIRPWLQDFDMGANYTAEMIRKEKQAVYDAGLNSWLLWDPANKYTIGALD
jgi:hypothetical protein